MKVFYTVIIAIVVTAVMGAEFALALATDEAVPDTITVTAQKQEENVQDVPMSITVLGGQEIEDRGIESLWNLVDYVPNLMTFDAGMTTTVTQPTMRGLSAPAMSFATSVGLYVDGVPTINAFGFEEGFIDIERIEVLRGPQGSLYGKNAETGVINIITHQPGNEFRGVVSGKLGALLSSSTDEPFTGGASLSLSGPIVKDRLFFSVAGQYDRQDGFVENTRTAQAADDRKKWFGRGKLRWTPFDELDMTLLVSRISHDGDAGSMNLTASGAAKFGMTAPAYRKVSSDVDSWKETQVDVSSLKLSYALNDAITLTSITALKETSVDGENDFDFTSAPIMKFVQGSQFKKFSQELRLNGVTQRLKWLVGFYYDQDENDIVTSNVMPSGARQNNNDIDGDGYAVFGQVSYFVTDKLNLIGGLRYEKQDMEYRNNILDYEREESWDEVSPKIALEYHINPELMTYASISKGYRSGGFNFVAEQPQYYSYDSETLWSYEVGMKSSFLDNRLVVNGSLYYMDISDMQVEEAVSPFVSYTTNAAEASAIGGELEVVAKLTRQLSLIAGFGYTDIEFDTFSDAKGDYEGNKNPYAPDYTFNIGAQYRHSNGFYARADLIGYGEIFFDKTNEYSRDAYQIVNAKLGYETENYDLYLYGRNVFDEEYDSVGYYSGFYTMYSDPGEIGLKVTYRF